MRIKENSRNADVEVYGIYWAEYQGKMQRFHLVIPYDGYEGFSAIPENDCEVIDPQLSSSFVLRKSDYQGDLFVHVAADEDDLIYDLLEHDPKAMKVFLNKLASIKLST